MVTGLIIRYSNPNLKSLENLTLKKPLLQEVYTKAKIMAFGDKNQIKFIIRNKEMYLQLLVEVPLPISLTLIPQVSFQKDQLIWVSLKLTLLLWVKRLLHEWLIPRSNSELMRVKWQINSHLVKLCQTMKIWRVIYSLIKANQTGSSKWQLLIKDPIKKAN